ncbi:hypothetical protein [Macrococcoides canis]|uniref:hypothetical protein n=1 Tax=Macrococcoides canis TaxID=1855823 RepID=UPI00165EA484|nr:hypothetical protein [Macrococcus canis]QNR09072.1 hypothetical protein GL258_12365 [Macrococcus canis]
MNNLIRNQKKIEANIEKELLNKNRAKKNYRKERANRLIRKGALLEKYFDCYNLSVDDTEELLKIFSAYVNHNKPEKFKSNK